MTVDKKIIVKLTIEAEIPFCSYGNKSLDKKAIRQIKDFLIETLRYEGAYCSLKVEPDGDGFFDDCTQKGKFKILKIQPKL
jgi:hypothetical protein